MVVLAASYLKSNCQNLSVFLITISFGAMCAFSLSLSLFIPKARILRGQCSSRLPCCLPFPSPVKGLGRYYIAGSRKVFCVTREWNRLVCSPPDLNAGVLITWAATFPCITNTYIYILIHRLRRNKYICHFNYIKNSLSSFKICLLCTRQA